MPRPRNQPVRGGALIRVSTAALALVLIGVPRSARADPEWNVGLTPALSVVKDGDEPSALLFYGSARADLLFGRERARDFGLGPYLGVGTAAFDDLRLMGGASLLIPAHEDFPFVASLGALLLDSREPGLDASLFWGVRSYNFHGSYSIAFGVSLGAQTTFGDEPNRALMLGAQVDGFAGLLPFLFAWGAAH